MRAERSSLWRTTGQGRAGTHAPCYVHTMLLHMLHDNFCSGARNIQCNPPSSRPRNCLPQLVGSYIRARSFLPSISPMARPSCRDSLHFDSLLPLQPESTGSATSQREGGTNRRVSLGEWSRFFRRASFLVQCPYLLRAHIHTGTQSVTCIRKATMTGLSPPAIQGSSTRLRTPV